MWRRPTSPEDEGALWLSWLVRLRWVALLAQVVTLAFVSRLLDSYAVLGVLLAVEVVLVIANVHATRLVGSDRRVSEQFVLAQLVLDVLALSVFFFLAGGPNNPFTTLYFIHIAMGAVMLRPASAAALTAVVLVVYALLYLGHLPLHLDRHTLGEPTLLAAGNLLAKGITAVSVGVFVVGLANTLRWREKLLLDAQERTARHDRLSSVGTMAAGAAHELNTPLSTVGLRLRRVARRHTDTDTVADLGVIRTQLDRCEQIVRQLLVSAGDPAASQLERGHLGALVADGIHLWSYGNSVEVAFSDRSGEIEVEVPRVAFVQGLVNLLENAKQAQEQIGRNDPIEVEVLAEDGGAVVVVRDHGVGLPPDMDRVGEPFFTTKPTGTGLGVFVARAVADGSGGALRYVRGRGCTEARWWYPPAAPRAASGRSG
jgi:two-component system sensor histidine kinase RegB